MRTSLASANSVLRTGCGYLITLSNTYDVYVHLTYIGLIFRDNNEQSIIIIIIISMDSSGCPFNVKMHLH